MTNPFRATEQKRNCHMNPKGANSQLLKCDNCGSDKHLWRKCDAANADEYRKMRARTAGGQTGTGSYTANLATSTNPGSSSALANWQALTG
jgi:hypothetical protein